MKLRIIIAVVLCATAVQQACAMVARLGDLVRQRPTYQGLQKFAEELPLTRSQYEMFMKDLKNHVNLEEIKDAMERTVRANITGQVGSARFARAEEAAKTAGAIAAPVGAAAAGAAGVYGVKKAMTSAPALSAEEYMLIGE